uniref:aspartate carbamoyltransferase n=1 Tax=Paramoeba aestuarina TaxID=180227 RepID=A0A7S4PCW9_9EUKA|mmetsp:Transcript_40213/g.63629  ORF Transcript_40213/g.63629 Transcript_40213/m.63629 type:complete len:713 (+) Transcript_40213:31-2169(+)
MSASKIVKLPPLVDVHVHLREPGGEHKETWDTGTAAALAGGMTTVLAMPNTKPSIVDAESLALVKERAKAGARCDYGIYVGANESNSLVLKELVKGEGDGKEEDMFCNGVSSLKMYLNDTFSTLKMGKVESWVEHFKHWTSDLPIVCHAEGQTMSAVLNLANLYNRHVHIAHVSLKSEIEMIKLAKEKGMKVTCEVCPHHLYFCREEFEEKKEKGEEYGSLGRMEVRPRLTGQSDRDALWDNIDVIDIFATDHAPHTVEEKAHDNPPPGFPGLETMLPLLLTAVVDGRLTLQQLIDRLHTNPHRIFNLAVQPDTYVEVEMGTEWKIPSAMKYSKSRWTPFEGITVKGQVKKVVIRGAVAYENGEVLASPGSGYNIRSFKYGTTPPNPYTLPSSSPFPSSSLPLSPSPPPPLKKLTTVKQLNLDRLYYLFALADEMRVLVKRGVGVCGGKVLACMFGEPSTRTSCSFQVAMQRLGGTVININDASSSTQKGETLTDTVKTLACYADIIVIRHPSPGSADLAASAVHIPVINAGDGTGEHPTQALLDAYTILHELGTLQGLTVVLLGDLKHGRTVHSLARLLSLFSARLILISPPSLSLPPELMKELRDGGVEVVEGGEEVGKVVGEADVLYVTRVQRERFEKEEEYERVKNSFVVTPELLEKTKEKMIVMHPLPRVNEITEECDSNPKCAYFRQMECGMYVRMALLAHMLNKA